MNKDYRYQLENRKLTAKRVLKYTCPGCGRRKCFVRYIDTRNNNQYVADDVGKCDHLHSCGYHYKPSSYNVSPRLESYAPNTDLADLVLGEAHPPPQ